MVALPSDDLGVDRSLLILDDDEAFLRRLGRAMEKRGFEVTAVDSVAAGRAVVDDRPPAYAVVDLMAGLDLTEKVRATVNVKNLFDETYLTSLMWTQSYYAAPRSASVRLDYTF